MVVTFFFDSLERPYPHQVKWQLRHSHDTVKEHFHCTSDLLIEYLFVISLWSDNFRFGLITKV
jgi:hypothetical protein